MLRKAAAAQNVTMLGLFGMGGVGKTALALKLAAELWSLYPDGQIYLDLKGTSEPLTPTQAMGHVIRAFQPEAKPPETQAQIEGFYRSLLSGKRALLLMDNARNVAQVLPLVPPKGSLVIVTSRYYFNIGGWFPLNLDVLPKEKAIELLLKLCPRIDKHSAEIANLCGQLPLALKLAAGTLAARETMSVTDYIRGLRDVKTRLVALDRYKYLTSAEGTIEASFLQSYEILSDDLKKSWRELAVFPLEFSSPAASALWQVEDKVAHERLGDLVACHLVDWDKETERYCLHNLARNFASARLSESPNEEHVAGKRHAKHYLKVLCLANDLYLEGGEKVVVGLRLFDIERLNIERGFEWASARIDTDDDAARMAAYYPIAGTECLSLRQHARYEQIPWLEAGLFAARKLEDRLKEGITLGNLGNAYGNLGDIGKAIEYSEKQLEIVREIGDRRGEGSALSNLGIAYAILGETQKAIECYENALNVAREIGDRRGEGNTLGNLGNAYGNLGDIGKAIEYFDKAIVIHGEIGDRRGEGTYLWNKAIALDTLEKHAEAIECAEAALAIYEAIEHPDVAKVRAALADWKKERGDR